MNYEEYRMSVIKKIDETFWNLNETWITKRNSECEELFASMYRTSLDSTEAAKVIKTTFEYKYTRRKYKPRKK
jgi:hypothetical protein